VSADDGAPSHRAHGEDLRKTVSRLAPGYARPGDLEDPFSGLGAALTRYRVLAYAVGIGLATLCFVGVPLQFAAGIPGVDSVVGPVHGILYMVYLLAAVDLARRARFTLLQMAAMVGAGFVPVLAFVVEHRVTGRVRSVFPEISARTAGGGPSALG
jgi:integral membrane protein